MKLPVALCLLILALAAGCQGPQWSAVGEGTFSQTKTLATFVIRDQGALDSYLAKNFQTDQRPNVSVDFSKDMLIAVHVGERPNSGYSVKIEKIESKGKGLLVKYREILPDTGPAVSHMAVLTHPYAIIKTASTDGEVSFTAS